MVVAGASALLTACGGSAGASAESPSQAAGPNTDCASVGSTATTSERITVKNAHGTLEGTLVLPGDCTAVPARAVTPRPVALIIAGSGPTDRDGDQASLKARPYALLAEALAAEGIGSLRYDKAGIGASRSAGPSEADLRFEMGADDAALFIAALRADPRVGTITIIGHSEGSLVGMLAAQRASVDGFVSLAGAGRPAPVVIREQLAKNLHDANLLAKANAILDALERGERVEAVPPELASLFRASVQGYLISWFKRDPAQEIRALKVANVLIAQGATDIQVGLADAERLAAARPDARLAVIAGMNHVLKTSDASSASQNDAYTNPNLPIVSELVHELTSFVKR